MCESERALPLPPLMRGSRTLNTLRLNVRQLGFMFRAGRELGETFCFQGLIDDLPEAVISHPDHIRSLFTAEPDMAPTLAAKSQMRPVVGPNSVLTALGARHMRQRKLLLPSFHGEAVARYADVIAAIANREIDSWPVGTPFALAPRMQAVTLEVILAGIFGIDGTSGRGKPERGLRRAVSFALQQSTSPSAKLGELINLFHEEPIGVLPALLSWFDRKVYAMIAARRAAPGADHRDDILSLLLRAETETGERLTDQEVRDELFTLVLAGHETAANSLAWAVERLLRNPAAYDRLRETARAGEDPDGYLEATIHESMRTRPVVPVTGRTVTVPWRLGDYAVPAGTRILVSMLLLHHREDVYPDPYRFWPERFVGIKPGTYTWIPFGGGIRRCLGAPLAMLEQRIVLGALARRTDLVAPDPRPERARHRNVTMIPARGTQVMVTARRRM